MPGEVAHACNPRHSGGTDRRIMVLDQLKLKLKTLFILFIKRKRAGGSAEVTDHLPSKHEALS
jgi:hypothetical protein